MRVARRRRKNNAKKEGNYLLSEESKKMEEYLRCKYLAYGQMNYFLFTFATSGYVWILAKISVVWSTFPFLGVSNKDFLWT